METHPTSVAIWDVPSRAVSGRPFKIKAGATCSAACQLTGREIEVCDGAGNMVARGILGETPWQGTMALHWVEMNLTAPGEEGLHSWTLRLSAQDSDAAHLEATSRFTFRTTLPPEHTVGIKVVDQETRIPVSGAVVRLGACREVTDESGCVAIEMPKGKHDLIVQKTDCKTFAGTVDVAADLTVEVELEFSPAPEQQAYWG